jgi:hypothetical protein
MESNEHLYELRLIANEHSVTIASVTGPHISALSDPAVFQVQMAGGNPLKLKLVLKKD